MKINQRLAILAIFSLGLTACGGGGGGGSKPVNTSSSATSSSAPPSSVSSSSSSVEVSSSSSSSAAPVVLELSMETGWRGNGTGNSGVNVNSGGVSFTASGDNIGAVTDLASPVMLEDAVIEMVVNVDSTFKQSTSALQIFAQIKGGNWDGEWGCFSGNDLIPEATDVTLTCTISEDDKKFNQTEHDVQIGIQAKGNTPAGVVTIKSAKVTLKPTAGSSSSSGSVYSANVDSLRDLADFIIGASVSNTDAPTYNILTNASEQRVVEKHFEQLTAGNIMKMSYLQPTQGNFTFTNADAFVDYANSKGMTVHGHGLVWHSDYQVPTFMKEWSGSAADFLTALETHITTIVDHYETKGNVVSWDVVNEALTDGNSNTPATFRTNDSPFYKNSGNSAIYIERAFQAARAAGPDVELYYNDYNIEQNGSKMTKLVEMLTDFQTRNIPIDGVGFQMHVCLNYPSASSIAAAMKRVVDKGLKVKITELDVAINQPYCDSYPANKINTFTQSVALAQKKRYCDIVKAYMDTVPAPQRGGISVWGTTDANTWLDNLYRTQFDNQKISWPLLFDNNYNDKPALRGFADGLQGITCTNQ